MKTYLPILLIVTLIAASCSSVQVYSDADKSVNFSGYKTYAWMQRPDSIDDLFYRNQLVDNNIKRFTNMELQARGLTVDTVQPDILVEYHSAVQDKMQNVTTPVYANPYPFYGYAPFGYPYGYYYNYPYIVGYNTQQMPYTQGTLVIDVIDRKKNQLIWRGWSVGTLTDEQALEAELPNDIHRVFKKYPVKPTTKVKG